MTRTPVNSSSIRSIGHEGSVLEVEFMSGAIYRYPDVPGDVAQLLLGAPSVGRAFASSIRQAGIAGTRVPVEDPAVNPEGAEQ